jgi:hypothetical protein
LRQLRLEALELGANGVDDLDRVGIGLAQDRQRDGRLAVERCRRLDGLEAVLDRGHFLQPDRVAALAADDQLGKLGGIAQLPVGLQGQRLRRPLERSDRRVGIGRAQGVGQLVEADVARRQRVGLDANANSEALLAEDVDLGDAVEGRQRRRDQVLGVVVQIRQAQRRRGHGQEQHRRVGRVDLAIGRRHGHLDRQLARGAQQRRLDVDRGGVDVAALLELERHRGHAERVARADHGQPRNGLELLLELESDRGRHRLRARARKLRRDVDDRRVVARQRRHRDLVEGDRTGDDDRRVEQDRQDRAADEELGQIHGLLPGGGRVASPAAAAASPSSPRRARPR